MKVMVLKSFTAFVGDSPISICEGQEVYMPPGQDWIRAGLVAPIESEAGESAETAAVEAAETAAAKAPETASVEAPETAVQPRGKRRKAG